MYYSYASSTVSLGEFRPCSSVLWLSRSTLNCHVANVEEKVKIQHSTQLAFLSRTVASFSSSSWKGQTTMTMQIIHTFWYLSKTDGKSHVFTLDICNLWDVMLSSNVTKHTTVLIIDFNFLLRDYNPTQHICTMINLCNWYLKVKR